MVVHDRGSMHRMPSRRSGDQVMDWNPQERLWQRRLTRRDFLVLASAGGASLCGCATDPVTGQGTLMLMSQSQEIAIDRGQSRHQFSRDYGVSQDAALNDYLTEVGRRLAQVSHRPSMPFSFRAVNSSHVNAYAFPGGSIAATRGVLVKLEDEAELAALLGHEVAHVAARHAAERQSSALLTQLVVAGAAAAVSNSKYSKYGGVAEVLGGVGATALLAHYSREAERESDSLGMAYASKSGANPAGMVGLMDVLSSEGKRRPSALKQLFATHPMSSERYVTAVQRTQEDYAGLAERPRNKERFMDNTSGLRRIGPAIEALHAADAALAEQNADAAESRVQEALAIAPQDYAALAMMAKIKLAKGDAASAKQYAERAKARYPAEAQGHHLGGVADLALGRYEDAYEGFRAYEQVLPGNPNTVFLIGASLEGMNHKKEAARHYYRYLQSVNTGAKAKHAYGRLVAWGFIKRR
jgi:beta-barrel assembly-enhancing protease